ncbi:ABC transporter ATP-binding protein [Streptomyces sp. SID13666]|uniref:dipeptide ABC transporter ATP-binding protein n=1 Tax=unclassified Streptomyces TaxID=2593676 RepID=UPI0013BF8BF4|nr:MULTISPECIES: ABC transporter ATP-binding protein [unclassified Streptomyces]NEA54251.1 ABC transporter ATP-binding protein [Streptomyces sp. SID13666]NEA70346.1 ABC transporter ATP-binding protein [Streptomyces sp. SID13588]
MSLPSLQAPPAVAAPPALRVRGLDVTFAARGNRVHAVRDLSFDLQRGEALGIVGESGSGKTAALLALMGLQPRATTHISGSALLAGEELVDAPETVMRHVRGNRIAMIFQDALAALSPFHRVGAQLEEMYRLHHPRAGRTRTRTRAVDMLDRVGIPEPDRRSRQYPHQFSGGMRQRVCIAMALMNEPEIVIADEPTTALDVTLQAQVLALLNDLRRDLSLSLVLITHDFGVVAETTDRTLVMYRGEKVEEGPTDALLAAPQHPYTRALVAAVPTMDTPPGIRLATVSAATTPPAPRAPTPVSLSNRAAAPAATGADILSVQELTVDYAPHSLLRWHGTPRSYAVHDVSFTIGAGESFGLVGESGCGKSTTAQVVMGLIRPTAGTVAFRGTDVTAASGPVRTELAQRVQIIFQDPYASLNPRRSVAQIITAPLRVHTGLDADARRERAAELLEQVGLERLHLDRYPHEFSGGQRQRIGIARALALGPELLIADEPVSALDVSVQAQVLNLLSDLRDELGISYLFVSHDLAVVRHFCDRIAVMRAGRIVETGTREEIFETPQHPYTRSLLDAVPCFRTTA